ncbi:MAG: glycosyltransferase family 4 protein [Oculatellaceae cyanobacterium Prado106]|nr:glycosyltransferase family 4 protein [Oculatellaceae cyanobacterium Prado106]
MKILIVRPMPEFSMDVYAEGLIAGLKAVRPDWQIRVMAPEAYDRTSRSWSVRWQKYTERFWHFPQRVKQQAIAFGADLIHILDHSDGHLVYTLQSTGIPVVATCHDLINFLYPENLKGSVKLPYVSDALWKHSVKGLQQAHRVVTVSQQTAQDVRSILGIGGDRIQVIPNAVEPLFQPLPSSAKPDLRPHHGISPDDFLLLNVGSNHPRKNLSTLLQAIQILCDRHLPIHLLKVGADFTPDQQTLIQTHHLPVTSAGRPDRATLVQYYNAADLLVAPSTHEGFGMTLLEAMACGIPIVTANQSALPEVIGEAGLQVNPQDASAIADAIHHLYQDTALRSTLRQRGLLRVRGFTWDAIATQMAQLYEQVYQSRSRPHPELIYHRRDAETQREPGEMRR